MGDPTGPTVPPKDTQVGMEQPEPIGAPLDEEEIDPNDYTPNAVPDPWHDTRAVHGDTGIPTKEEEE